MSWSTKKGDIKRMKAENLPIKVECFRVRERGRLEDIGYLLIPLRNIPTCLYKNDEVLPSPRWYKIMGVPSDVLHNKPELHLNVIIQPEQECLSAGHLRGKYDEEDESYAEPDILNHFELKIDEEEEEETDPKQNLPTPKMEAPPVVEEMVVQELPQQQKTVTLNEDTVTAEKYAKSLEDWKKDEKENFMAHLKKVENSFLESMFEEWQRKKHEEENKLQWTIEECERLSKKLEDGYAQMKDFQRADKESKSLAATQAELDEKVDLEKKRNSALEMELREQIEENKVLRSRFREIEKNNATAEEEIAHQIVSNGYFIIAFSFTYH